MNKTYSRKTKILDFLSDWLSVILAPIHLVETIGSVIGSGVFCFGLIAKGDSKIRNLIAYVVFYGIFAPFILLKSIAAIKGVDDYLIDRYEESKEEDEKKIHVISKD